jgi:hypothetical protein
MLPMPVIKGIRAAVLIPQINHIIPIPKHPVQFKAVQNLTLKKASLHKTAFPPQAIVLPEQLITWLRESLTNVSNCIILYIFG